MLERVPLLELLERESPATFVQVEDGARLTVMGTSGVEECEHPLYLKASRTLVVESKDIVWKDGRPSLDDEVLVTVVPPEVDIR